MKQILSLLLAVCMTIQTNAADCSKPVTLLKQGESAPCSGFLFSYAQEQKVYLLDQDNQLLQQQLDNEKKLVDSYKKSLVDFKTILDEEGQKTELWRKAAEDSTQKLIASKDSTVTRDIIMVLLGIVIAGSVGYAVDKLSK